MAKTLAVLVVLTTVWLPVAGDFSLRLAQAAPEDSDETPERRAEIRRMKQQSSGWRKVCLGLLKQTWLPKLRQLPGAKVELKTAQAATLASINLLVRVEGAERAIHLFWNPDECDAGGPNGGLRPSGFDWKSPQTPLERLLIDAGNDCLLHMK